MEDAPLVRSNPLDEVFRSTAILEVHHFVLGLEVGDRWTFPGHVVAGDRAPAKPTSRMSAGRMASVQL